MQVNAAAMTGISPYIFTSNPNVKDSRWLTLEVCREFQRSKCSRTENECKFAHPPPHVEVQNGRVTCCFDSIKGKCQRKEPPCKYLHPPQHLREQLLQNGRNNLILKNLQMQYIAAGMLPPQPAGTFPTTAGEQSQVANSAEYTTSPNPRTSAYYGYEQVPQYLTVQNYNSPYHLAGAGGVAGIVPTVDGAAAAGSVAATTPVPVSGGVLTGAATSSKITRPDRLEVCREFERASCTRQPTECRFAHPPDNVSVDQTDNTVTVCMDFIKGKCSRDSCRYFHPPPHLQAQIKLAQQRANAATAAAAAAATGATSSPAAPLQPGSIPVVPVMKRHALDNKSGIPMYQPHSGSATAAATAAYQHALAMQLQQQPFVPVSIAGHPPSVPRF